MMWLFLRPGRLGVTWKGGYTTVGEGVCVCVCVCVSYKKATERTPYPAVARP